MRLAVFAVLSLSLVGAGVAEEDPKTPTPTLDLLTCGSVDAGLRRRVADYIEEQYLVRPVFRDALQTAGDSAAELKKQVVGRAADDAYLLALCNAPAVEQELLVFRPEHCAAVNVAALESGTSTKGMDKDLFARRVEKESLRALARLVGIPSCPFPRCALREHRTVQELDWNSRNPCPPCLTRVRQQLDALGVTGDVRPSQAKDTPAVPTR